MSILQKFKRKSFSPIVSTANIGSLSHPFHCLGDYSPDRRPDLKLFESLREAVPVIDAAIGKTVRLTGTFNIECRDKRVQDQLNSFLANVKVGATGHGIGSFLSTYLDNLLTYGTAVGEIITDLNGCVYGLYNADLDDIALSIDQSPMKLVVCVRQGMEYVPVKNQELISVSALNPSRGCVYGNSILSGLPFVSDILLKIYNSIGVNWDRAGNIRYAVTYIPGENENNARANIRQIADEWSKAMSKNSPVSDFVAAGDVSIKVIGADNAVLDSEVPVRQMLEQIVAKLSIPPFLLGLSWSTTERMSAQQADILTSELEYYRELLNPIIDKICTRWFLSNGYLPEFKVNWNNINLQDELELANARYINAKASAMEAQLKGVENID